MEKTVILIHHYNASAERLFRVATDWQCFTEAMKGIATFDGLPEEPIRQGMVIEAKIRLFGILPPMEHRMEVKLFDETLLRVESHESGGAIKAWDHIIQVEGDDRHSKITDTITINAGWMTAAYVLWARFVYSARHKPRLKMLGLM